MIYAIGFTIYFITLLGSEGSFGIKEPTIQHRFKTFIANLRMKYLES